MGANQILFYLTFQSILIRASSDRLATTYCQNKDSDGTLDELTEPMIERLALLLQKIIVGLEDTIFGSFYVWTYNAFKPNYELKGYAT